LIITLLCICYCWQWREVCYPVLKYYAAGWLHNRLCYLWVLLSLFNDTNINNNC